MRHHLARLIAGLLILSPAVAFAQLLPGTEVFTVGVSPNHPAPYGRVILTPTSGSLDLSTATMEVIVGGRPIYKGSAKPVSVSLGAAGTLTTAQVVMVSNGKSYSKTISVRPQELTLIVEPLASAPALYPGKPLVPLEGAVRVVSVANLRNSAGAPINPTSLSYSWVVDDTRIFNSSGIGKNTIVVASPLQYRSRDVSVTVSAPDGSLVGGSKVTLTAQEPLVRVYESDPLLGVLFNRAITGSYNVASKEKTLFAAPYSFPTNVSQPTLSWSLNGSLAQNGPLITLRPTGSGAGAARLSLSAKGSGMVLAGTELSLSFGAAPSGLGILGL